MSLEFGTYKVADQGKMIKDSKRSHVWIVHYNGQRYEIMAKESFVSKKFRFYVQRKLIAEFKTREDAKIKGFDFEANNMYFKLKKLNKSFKLWVNNSLFTHSKLSKPVKEGALFNFAQKE